MKNDESSILSYIDIQRYLLSKEVTLYGDPLQPYKDPDGNYIDSDSDNIPDIVRISIEQQLNLPEIRGVGAEYRLLVVHIQISSKTLKYSDAI